MLRKPRKKPTKLKPFMLPRIYGIVRQLYGEDMTIQDIYEVFNYWKPSRTRLHQILQANDPDKS